MAEWNYHANGGAAGWGALTLPGSSELAFPDCNGRAQSPVDIPGVPSTSGDALRLDWRPSTLSILNTGLALQVDCEAGSTLSTGGKTYELQQFHFHTPSEHALQGSFGPLEVHFVHQASDGELAVVGVLIDDGRVERGAAAGARRDAVGAGARRAGREHRPAGFPAGEPGALGVRGVVDDAAVHGGRAMARAVATDHGLDGADRGVSGVGVSQP